MVNIDYWKSVAILLAIAFLTAAFPRLVMIVRIGVGYRSPEDCDRMLEWFWFTNAGIMIGVVISVIVLVSAVISQ